jgi:hypothetical protein
MSVYVVIVTLFNEARVDSVHRFAPSANQRRFDLMAEEPGSRVEVVKKEIE